MLYLAQICISHPLEFKKFPVNKLCDAIEGKFYIVLRKHRQPYSRSLFSLHQGVTHGKQPYANH